MTPVRHATLALALYLLLSWLLFCQGTDLRSHVLGYGADPGLIIWFLAWWPWALAHHVFSLHSYLLWVPQGLNLGWTTSVPLLALLGAPATLAAGPLVTYNLLVLVAPALAAWSAYFLCRGLGASPWPAFYGGLLFGFSSYMAAQSFDHLNLSFCAAFPLAVLVAVRRVRGQAGRTATVLWLAALLGGEFLISEELLATFCLFAVLAFLLAYAVERRLRPALRALALDILLAAPLALLPAAPFLWAMARGVYDIAHPGTWQVFFSTDLLNLIIPTQGTLIGGQSFTGISFQFTGDLDEQGGYLGLPLLLLLLVIAADGKLRRRLWLPLAMIGLAMLAALGPVLQIGGHMTGIPLPWALVARLPLLGNALPGRCTLYAFLAVAIVVSLWLSCQPAPRRYIIAAGVCLTLLPAPHPPWPSPYSPLFRPGRLQQVLGPKPVLLILPFGINGPSSFWQAENDFGFTQVGGYLGFPPAWAFKDAGLMQIFHNEFEPGATAAFVELCQRDHVQYIVAAAKTPAKAKAALASLGWPVQKIDDLTIYTVPAAPPP